MKGLCTLLLIAGTCFMQSPAFAQKNNKPPAQLNHVAVYVLDLQKSGNFYTKIIGLDTIPEPFHDGKHIWLQIAPHIQMHIIQGAEKFKEYYKNNHFCFSVASIEDFTKKLKQNNIGWEDRDGLKQAFTTRVDGVKQIWLQDPDGYWIEINDVLY